MKSKPPKPGAQASRSHGPQLPSRSNKQVNRQSRKLLGQHYRAKYGVK